MNTPFTKAGLSRLLEIRGLRLVVRDPRTPGLQAELRTGGTVTFFVFKRKPGGGPVRVRLGTFPTITVEQARKQAQQALAELARGGDPSAKQRNNRKAPTLKDLFEQFIELPTRTKSKRPKSAITVRDYRMQFTTYLADWHGRKVSTITRNEIEGLHNRLATEVGHHTANRVLSLVKVILNLAVDEGRILVNPAARIMAFEEESRERFLQADELPKFWTALEAEPNEAIRDFFKLLIFTGQRCRNVLEMRWSEINLDRGVWIIPRTKSGRHEVPLVSQAIEVLRRRHEANGSSEYVLLTAYGKARSSVPRAEWKGLLTRAGIDNLRIHDLRRSLGSWQAITGASLPVIGKTLGHATASSTAVYSRLSDDPVRTAMGTAVATMMNLAKGGANNG